ncbi:hypothetical protein N7448_003475 [Penicillium atrosanguineum]|uniref:Rhodopsin domain-containing protein n=1 Tax=Penicillium atrosanguineum TaxID=1132637 RepID=A0A9W9L7L0_9EURO|nr:hypothetical protein N7526_009280 [Penicillium atrosanguineum]KAJ5140067.1 hypothetical protein N7448_003475 [Penicillium atrosanguineum]KAJ5315500.1 hypothetical protein N7476_005807 [Penicillium atrosanguineum]
MSPEALAEMLNAPALPAPEGITPNFDNPSNANGLAWFVTTFCMVVATMCLLLRLYVRVILEKKFRAEEILVILAYGAYWGTAYAGYSLIFTPGYYVHTWNLHNGDLVKPLYYILVYGCCYSATLPLIKSAILMDWCRVFVPVQKSRNSFWWGCAAIISLQCLWGLLCVILLNMQCRPHEAIWKFYLPSKCYSLPDVMLTSASVQVVSDIAMFLLPQRIIWGLGMNWQKKIGVSVLFGVGILACVAAILRLVKTVAFASETDTMYLIGPLLFWACAEMTCGFFIFSVPCLSKLIIESGLPGRVKNALGFNSRSSEHSNADSLEEGHIALQETGSESQTRLHDGVQSNVTNPTVQVMRTTDVTVSNDAH